MKRSSLSPYHTAAGPLRKATRLAGYMTEGCQKKKKKKNCKGRENTHTQTKHRTDCQHQRSTSLSIPMATCGLTAHALSLWSESDGRSPPRVFISTDPSTDPGSADSGNSVSSPCRCGRFQTLLYFIGETVHKLLFSPSLIYSPPLSFSLSLSLSLSLRHGPQVLWYKPVDRRDMG